MDTTGASQRGSRKVLGRRLPRRPSDRHHRHFKRVTATRGECTKRDERVVHRIQCLVRLRHDLPRHDGTPCTLGERVGDEVVPVEVFSDERDIQVALLNRTRIRGHARKCAAHIGQVRSHPERLTH